MKKSDLLRIIKEEIQNVLNENPSYMAAYVKYTDRIKNGEFKDNAAIDLAIDADPEVIDKDKLRNKIFNFIRQEYY